LAQEVTEIVHGKQGVEIALKVTEAAAPGSETLLNAETLEQLGTDLENRLVTMQDIEGVLLVDFLVKTGLLPSKGEAKRRILNGGVYLNNEKIADEKFVLSADRLINKRLLLVALGKKNKFLIRVE
jgi:tyrosyl-tRNA synthetase